jgi:hypothetical protein
VNAESECVLCAVARMLHGTEPLGPPVRLIEIEGVAGWQPICAEHYSSWKALDDEDED